MYMVGTMEDILAIMRVSRDMELLDSIMSTYPTARLQTVTYQWTTVTLDTERMFLTLELLMEGINFIH
ncbi:Cuticular protein RR2 family member 26 [Caligus rogercresseyi]|uniref:Cuticular protein RR2 family member 26 n=1 Tax=Caligus rogercresseyi TaxID=217165 RepID=A0A7T8K0T7_CALRO|nr:Cuticular protein RR2 family member 26 [Caligus rogercresseyi]